MRFRPRQNFRQSPRSRTLSRRRVLLERLEERALLAALSWVEPAAITYGTLLSSEQLNAEATMPGTFSYEPSAGSRLNPGEDQTLTVTFTPDDTLLDAVTDSVTIDVLSSAEFRTLNGSFNHLDDAQAFVAGGAQLRQMNVAYQDGISEPRGGDPSTLANPRDISNVVHDQQQHDVASNRHLSRMVFQFGQFIDHDIVLTPEADEEFDIGVPQGDPSFDPFNTGAVEIPLKRSEHDPATGTSTENPRQQVNKLTSYIDGSTVYGSDDERASALRSHAGGKMLISDDGLLPINGVDTPEVDNANPTGLDPTEMFAGGDVRANEQIGLTAMHTLFVREHNHWADRIAAESFAGHDLSDPQVDEAIYQQARRIVGAQLQIITYNEFLPAVIGTDALPEYEGFDSTVDPRISNEFSTAAFRVGHTMLPRELTLIDETGEFLEARPLADAFFRPDVVMTNGIDSILHGIVLKPQQEIDQYLVEDVRNFLFGPPGAGGLDLASLNIQRGRDHGLPTYSEAREELGLAPTLDFGSITSDPDAIEELASVYDSVADVDLWVAGIMEDHVDGTSLGETFTAIWIDQFTRLRDGDRYFYLNQSWDSELLEELESTSLSDIIARNTQLSSLPDNAFVVTNQDFGDAPSGITSPFYSTMMQQNGPRHATGPLFLGQSVDVETDGQPTRSADGDGDDEDGVVQMADLVAVFDDTTLSSVAIEASLAGRLDGWIDFNRDGDFEDAGEQVFEAIDVAAGKSMMNFVVPAGAKDGTTVGRFRISSQGGLPSTGPASDGEVEDYMIDVLDADESPDVTVVVGAGGIDMSVESDRFFASTNGVDQFEAPLESLGSLSIVGSQLDDSMMVGFNANELAGRIDRALHLQGQDGSNTLVLVGPENALDLTDPGVIARSFSTLDLSGADAVSVRLDATAVEQLCENQLAKIVTIVAGQNDVLDVADGSQWRLVDPINIENLFQLVGENTVTHVRIVADVPHPWQNFLQAGDTNNDGSVSAADALRIINELRVRQFSARNGGELLDPLSLDNWENVYFDHNGDDAATALDALRVINELGQQQLTAEGESIAVVIENDTDERSSVAADEVFADWSEPIAGTRELMRDTASSDAVTGLERMTIDDSDAPSSHEPDDGSDEPLSVEWPVTF